MQSAPYMVAIGTLDVPVHFANMGGAEGGTLFVEQ